MDMLLAWLVNLCYAIGGMIFLPVVVYRMVRSGRYLRGWSNRLGLLPKRYGDQPAIWIHAVSVGEVNATCSLVDRLRQQLPFHEIYITVTTDTGYDRACNLYGRERVMFFPMDFTFTMGRALNRLRPSMIILMELEVWFNLASLASKAGIPVVIANGRVTQRSVRRYGFAGSCSRRMFGSLALVAAQDQHYAKRFEQLGVPVDRIVTVGSLKWDTAAVAKQVSGSAQLARAVGIEPGQPLLVAGSTGNEVEEEAVIRAYQQLRRSYDKLQLAIVPRKPERFEAVAKLIRGRGFHVVRRSRCPDQTSGVSGHVGGKQTVVLGDTMGELRKFYCLATVVFVGRSLVPMGGSDVMEIAALGRPMLFGKHMDNFSEAAGKLLGSKAAVQVDQPERLASVVGQLMADKDKLRQMSEAARQVVADNQGATARTARLICQLLDMEYDQTENGVATPMLKAAS